MKTIFTKGMKVYDQVLEPNKKGTIVEIKEGCLIAFPVSVQFENCTDIRSYTLDGRYNRNGEQTLSTKPYKVVYEGFEQKLYIPTFEEAWTETDRIYEPKSEYDKEEFGGYPSQELANAAEALRRLLFLRDYYNKGWQPNWEDDEWKYFIEYYRGELEVNRTCGNSRVLHFKSRDIAKKFLKEQKELLEIAKPLL
jgi:hypothetical protein